MIMMIPLNKRYFKFEENIILPYHFTHESDICKEHKMQIYIYWQAHLFANNDYAWTENLPTNYTRSAY